MVNLTAAKITLIVCLIVCGIIVAFGAKAQTADDDHLLHPETVDGSDTYIAEVTKSCAGTTNMANFALAFAILGWITALAGTAIAALSLVKPSMLPAIVGVIVSAVCMLFLTIAWSFAAASSHQEICKDRPNDHAFAFLLIAWILSIGWLAYGVLDIAPKTEDDKT